MAEPPEIDELVRRFLDLWQQQLSAWAQDPALARQLGALMALAPRPPWFGVPGAGPADGAAGGAAAAGPAFGGGGGGLDRLAQRLADLERRIDRLESKPRPRGAKTGGKPKKRKS